MGSRLFTTVRWRDDTGWELRCADCAAQDTSCFWPLTDEFWDKRRGMNRCRACYRSYDNRMHRERYASDAEHRARRLMNAKKYRTAARQAQHIKDQMKWERTKNDPVRLERAREKGREAQRRYRARQAEARAA